MSWALVTPHYPWYPQTGLVAHAAVPLYSFYLPGVSLSLSSLPARATLLRTLLDPVPWQAQVLFHPLCSPDTLVSMYPPASPTGCWVLEGRLFSTMIAWHAPTHGRYSVNVHGGVKGWAKRGNTLVVIAAQCSRWEKNFKMFSVLQKRRVQVGLRTKA
jgi:hypothetical protein